MTWSSRRLWLRTLGPLCATCALAAAGASAFAEGYTVTPAQGLIEKRPTDAARLGLTPSDPAKSTIEVALPFAFRYYGERVNRALISAEGYIVLGATDAITAPVAGTSDGVIAPLWTALTYRARGATETGDGAESAVFTWTVGEAPTRRFIVSWEDVGVPSAATSPDAAAPGTPPRRVTAQLHLYEGPGRIVFAYSTEPRGVASASVPFICGFDEPRGPRFTAPRAPDAAPLAAPIATLRENVATSLPATDFIFDPRTVIFNTPAAPKVGAPVAWEQGRSECVTAPGSADGANYVAKGTGWFFVPDRALATTTAGGTSRVARDRRAELAAEDRATFPVSATPDRPGDDTRWVKQVLDGKAVLIPKDGSPAVRLWFRVIEYFTIDERGLAGEDSHTWNLRRMLSAAFAADDPRGKIANYAAWRGMASSRLSVVKLFAATADTNADRQFDTGRRNEYVLWCARLHPGPRGALGDNETPGPDWTRFALLDLDEAAPQHADRADVRDVADPNYVDGGYEYVIRGDAAPAGWEALKSVPRAALVEEPFATDTAAPGGR